MKFLLGFVLALCAACTPLGFAPEAVAQLRSEPRAIELASTVPPPRDIAYPGVITLDVDATDTDQRIWRIKQTIPVERAGPITLLYAQWIMGNHAPRGPIYNYAGLHITAKGQPVAWRRDPLDVYAFHVDVPTGASQLDVEAQFLTPLDSAQGPRMVTPEMLRLNWYVAALYPAGYYARRIPMRVAVKLPSGWDYATALETEDRNVDTVTFKTESWETVIDSPLFAGRHMRKFDLDPGGRSRVTLNAMGDAPDMVSPSDAIIGIMRELVKQADKLFGARHFDHYDFLLSVSDQLATAGIEHQRSSNNGVTANYFRTWDTALISRDLLAHEYVHSWNGKYRRGEDLWRPNFNMPVSNSLLWVYEGQTQYWGHVLAARAGFFNRQQALDDVASLAATYEARVGRLWRPLADTTMDPIIAARRSLPWGTWQRSEDYYSEGRLIWLDVDTLIRERSRGRRSLDDFARAFFGMNDGDWGVLTYTRKDVVDALNAIEPYDWEGFLRARVDAVAPTAPLAGIERGGYRLVYVDTPSESWRALETRGRNATLTYSIGLSVNAEGRLTAVQWDGPAFRAGLSTAATLLQVNEQAFSVDGLKEAVAATAKGTPLRLQYRLGADTRTITLDYAGGHRYPKLEPIPGQRRYLDDILTPR